VLLRRNARHPASKPGEFNSWILFGLLCAFLLTVAAQAQQSTPDQTSTRSAPPVVASPQSQSSPLSTARVSGTVLDEHGAMAEGAQVQLTFAGQPARQALSNESGEYSFTNLPAGPFQLTITAPGFDKKVFSGVLSPGQAFLVPEIALKIAGATTEVRVGGSTEEIAEAQIKQQEKQRVLGIAPNFYVSYIPDAAPLNTRQKFDLAWKSCIDPMTFVGVGILAGFEQAADEFGGYGQGTAGYAKRFGAGYADNFIGTFMDSAVFPALFKQDPRYFYQGTGTTKSRLAHALGNAVIRKGDNGKWQPNYSGVLGSFVAAGISNIYYPPDDRGGALVAENALISIGSGAVAGVFQEFVLRKITTHSRDPQASGP
jgi:hypothetical protein